MTTIFIQRSRGGHPARAPFYPELINRAIWAARTHHKIFTGPAQPVEIPPSLALQFAPDLARPETVSRSTVIWRHQAMESIRAAAATSALAGGPRPVACSGAATQVMLDKLNMAGCVHFHRRLVRGFGVFRARRVSAQAER
jgi:hypothetical protein